MYNKLLLCTNRGTNGVSRPVETNKTKLPPKIQNHKGLSYFVKNRAKFEGWLKVELCEILSDKIENIVPEKDRIDIVGDDWALELKTINTNYHYTNIEDKTRPITKNIEEVIKDIDSLINKQNSFKKAVIFIAFPLSLSNHSKYWEKHISKINEKLEQLEDEEIKFHNIQMQCSTVV